MKKIDATGLVCPEPVLRTRATLEKEHPGNGNSALSGCHADSHLWVSALCQAKRLPQRIGPAGPHKPLWAGDSHFTTLQVATAGRKTVLEYGPNQQCPDDCVLSLLDCEVLREREVFRGFSQ